MAIKRFEDIEAWQHARELTKQIYEVTKEGLFAQDYGLIVCLIRHKNMDKMTAPRLASARFVMQECFWGEYHLSVQEILDRLDRNEPGFERFLFSKIIENSRYPSRHLRNLFPPGVLQTLLDRYLKQAGDKKRFRLIAANLTGNYRLAPEYQWRR